MAWHRKSESEYPGDNSSFENADHENNFEVEKVGRINSVVFNHVDSDYTNTNSNNSDQADSNNDSADVWALN